MHKDTIEQVKERMDVLEVVEHFGGVTFKQSGSIKQCCCPLHGERSASFTYFHQTNTYKCFGCGEQGNAISFVMKHKTNGDFLEAVRLLATFYNIEIKDWSLTKEERTVLEHTEQLRLHLLGLQNLFLESKKGIEYFEGRKLKKETLEKFGVGYAANDTITKFQIDAVEKEKIGVYNEAQKPVIWDRVTLPIHDPKGNIIAFGSRIYRKEQTGPKWLNTRNSELFVKGKMIFNLHRARSEAIKTGKLYITEGYPDVMAMDEIGKTNCVAVCGTELTAEHCALLAHTFKNTKMQYIVVFNNDSKKRTTEDGRDAGRDAALRAIPKLLSVGEVKTVRLQFGNDIQEIYEKFNNLKVFEDLSHAQDAIAFVIAHLWGTEDEAKDRSATEKADLHKRIAEIISKVKDEDVRDVYINDYCEAIQITPKKLLDFVLKFQHKTKQQQHKQELHIKVLDSYYELQADYDITNKTSTPIYIRRAVAELEREYGKGYCKNIKKYQNWICDPSHVDYQQTVKVNMNDLEYSFFNEYKPLPYQSRAFELPEGWEKEDFDYEKIPQIKTTAAFYKHIYNQEKYGNKYTKLGWDYFAIMFLHPHRPLQARCFVSTEEGTGKSTIYNYEQGFFGHNATKTTAKRLITNFNADLACKLLVAIEETKDDKGSIENDLKDLITGQEKIVEAKFQDAKRVRSFEKYLFLSNHPDSFMKVGKKTTRFAVIDVPTIKTKDNNLLEKMMIEIPYVMYFLEKRGVLTPDTDRLWFEPTLWENEALLNLRQASKDVVIKNMENMIENIFIKCDYPNAVIKLSSSILQKYMVLSSGKSYEQKQPNYFTDKCKNGMGLLCKENPSSFEYLKITNMPDTEHWDYSVEKDKQRYIEFPIWRFMTIESIKENFITEKIQKIVTDIETSYFHNSEATEYQKLLQKFLSDNKSQVTEQIGDDLPF